MEADCAVGAYGSFSSSSWEEREPGLDISIFWGRMRSIETLCVLRMGRRETLWKALPSS